MRRMRFVSTCSLALMGLFVASGHGQTPAVSRRTLLGMYGPPPIERGISPDRSHAPGTPETIRRQSIRAASSILDRTGRSGSRYRAGRVIVKFKDGVTSASRLSALSVVSRTATLFQRAAYQNFDVVQIGATEDAEAAARLFRARPDVEYAQAAYRVQTQLVPNDLLYSCQWNLPLVDMEKAWDIQPAAGSAITVAVLDTGIAFRDTTLGFDAGAFTTNVDADGNVIVGPPGARGTAYPALGHLTLQFVAATELGPSTRFVAPYDFIWNDNLPIDLDGHGTHVSGTIGQRTDNRGKGVGDQDNGGGTAGVAFNVKLMPVKVISTQWDDIFSSPNEGTDDVVALGIRYAVDSGAKIINMSIGRTGPANCATNPNQDECSPVIEDAIKYAVGKGAFVVVAGGNDFQNGNPTEVLAEIASRVQGAVSVAAVNQAKGHAYYSSSGSYVELAAPGGDLGTLICNNQLKIAGILQQTLDLQLVDTFDASPSQFTAPRFDSLAYYFFVGTSEAAPHVAGVAAMLMQQGITSPAAIEGALKRFATRLGTTDVECTKRDPLFGCGLIDARNTLRGLGLAK